MISTPEEFNDYRAGGFSGCFNGFVDGSKWMIACSRTGIVSF
jgi:hypothetical protein